ncbi:MAG: alkaline phosphatase family protein [Thermoplasmata archaeon]|nr:alkaline phosphatase family protein [Thermoplasmata archaeon]
MDCASPKLLFEEFIDDLPNIRRLMGKGVHGKLRTIIPPITIPAWLSMVTGKDAGRLGLYGFRHRRNNSYTDIWLATRDKLKEKALWHILGDNGLKSTVIGLPPSYPVEPINGHIISGFMTPDTNRQFTHPPELKHEIEDLVGEYLFDVVFRTDEKDQVLEGIYEMTEKRFRVIRYLLENKEWDLFFFVEIGLDRLQHGFWKYHDPTHHLHEPGNRFQSAIKDYYEYLDKEIGKLLEIIDDDTIVFIVSDHGAKAMKGCFCVNEWLMEQGYLKLRKSPEEVTDLEKADIDWSRTRAWGWGGYYARIFINLKGREAQGIVPPSEYDEIRDEISTRIMEIKDPQGIGMKNMVLKPEETYNICNGDPPDLMVFFDDLSWRSAGTIGHGSMYLPENDKGPDDAVHDWQGVFLIYDPKENQGRDIGQKSILDIAPTILKAMEIPIPEDMKGEVIEW